MENPLLRLAGAYYAASSSDVSLYTRNFPTAVATRGRGWQSNTRFLCKRSNVTTAPTPSRPPSCWVTRMASGIQIEARQVRFDGFLFLREQESIVKLNGLGLIRKPPAQF